jgi:hypothetical protein
MRHPSGEANLIAESLQQSLIPACIFRKEFERNRLAQRQIIGAINFSHATATEQCNDAITASQQASGKKSTLGQ